MKCKWIKKLTAGIIFLAAVGSLSGCQKAATSENLFRDIEVNMTSVESAEENQIDIQIALLADRTVAIPHLQFYDLILFCRNERDTGDGILSGGRRREDCDLQWNG